MKYPPTFFVDRQLDAYNRHDIDTFMECYAPDVEVYQMGGALLLQGRDEMRRTYLDIWATNPNQRADLIARLTHGNFVVDSERVHGRSAKPDSKAMVIYEVGPDYIERYWLLPQL